MGAYPLVDDIAGRARWRGFANTIAVGEFTARRASRRL
jgi:hypothetical protein